MEKEIIKDFARFSVLLSRINSAHQWAVNALCAQKYEAEKSLRERFSTTLERVVETFGGQIPGIEDYPDDKVVRDHLKKHGVKILGAEKDAIQEQWIDENRSTRFSLLLPEGLSKEEFLASLDDHKDSSEEEFLDSLDE